MPQQGEWYNNGVIGMRVRLMAKGRQSYEVQKKEKGTFYLGKVVKLCCFLK